MLFVRSMKFLYLQVIKGAELGYCIIITIINIIILFAIVTICQYWAAACQPDTSLTAAIN